MTAYIPHRPTAKQAAFLLLPHMEALYGGAAGGGKSDTLLMAALQWVDVPGYAALLLRRTFADLALPGALMDRAADWLQPTAATWSERDKRWTFPSGASLNFGYLETEAHKYRYQSSEFQYIGFDELTQFRESQYRYLFSRLRRMAGVDVPLRMRAASNPGGEGHQWVFERFLVQGRASGRIFIPANLGDNPHIDRDEYMRALAELDDVTKAQLLEGLWVTDPAQKPFRADWWRGRNRYATGNGRLRNQATARWLSWDTAVKDEEQHAYTALTVVELLPDYRLVLREVWRDKLQFPDLPDRMLEAALRYNADGKLRGVLIEDKATGTTAYQTLMRTAPEWLQRLLVAFQPQGSKEQRARQAAVWCKRGCVLLPHPDEAVAWLYEFEQELFNFPHTVFADQVDSFGQAVIYLENLLAEGWHARGGTGDEPGADE